MWVSRQLNLSALLVDLRKQPLVRVLDFIHRQGGPLAYADLSTPAFICGKPLDLTDSERCLAHLRKRGRAKTPCTEGQCNKKFRDAEALFEHLLEHPRFRARPEEEQEEFMSQLVFQDE